MAIRAVSLWVIAYEPALLLHWPSAMLFQLSAEGQSVQTSLTSSNAAIPSPAVANPLLSPLVATGSLLSPLRPSSSLPAPHQPMSGLATPLQPMNAMAAPLLPEPLLPIGGSLGQSAGGGKMDRETEAQIKQMEKTVDSLTQELNSKSWGKIHKWFTSS